MFHDFGLVCPLSASVARLLETRRGGDRAERLGRGDVDLGLREVGQTADVVQVEVRDDDMADIVWRKPSRSIWWAAVSSLLRMGLSM